MIKYEVFYMDEKIGTLITDGERRDRLFPLETIRKCNEIVIRPEWKNVKDTGWVYIPIFENMIRDTMRQNPNAKYIARFTNEFVLVKTGDVKEGELAQFDDVLNQEKESI